MNALKLANTIAVDYFLKPSSAVVKDLDIDGREIYLIKHKDKMGRVPYLFVHAMDLRYKTLSKVIRFFVSRDMYLMYKIKRFYVGIH